MIKFNFFDYNSVLIGLSALYEIDDNRVLMMAVEAQCEENPTVAFIEAADIKLDSVDISQVMLHCKHIMTIDGDFESIKKYGLITLDNIFDFEFITSKPIFEDYEDYYKFNKVPMYELYNVSPNFYGNVFILKWAIEVLGVNSPTVYGALRRDTKVAYEDIVISKYEITKNSGD